MAYSETKQVRTFEAGAALAQQFLFVVQGANGQVTVLASAGARSDGVLNSTATTAGQSVAVQYDGRAQVLAGGTIARGGRVATNASGRGIAATTGQIVLGWAEEAAVNNQIFTVRLDRAESAAP